MRNTDGIIERLERLELENLALRREVAELREAPAVGATGPTRQGQKPISRRTLIGAGVGAIAATATSVLGVAAPALAADGDPVLLGKSNTAASGTHIVVTGTHVGLQAGSPDSTGLAGVSLSEYGVRGSSDTSNGVDGVSNSGTGIHGTTHRARGTAFGVFGEAAGPECAATMGWNHAGSGWGIGTQGTSDSPAGLGTVGWANAGGVGVVGFSGPTFPAATPRRMGVLGRADSGAASVGVSGVSAHGRGGTFKGGVAQMRLVPSSAATHPGSGSAGDLFLDKSHRLWFCKGGTNWKQLA